ncbi:MAG: sulfite exporter TauE/SafE family protein [Candidatus Sericytochromatia bacterium]
MSLIFGYLAAILMGGVLGLLGGGGSILTVPILVYLFHLSPLTATGYSLLIVGLAALIGMLGHLRAGRIRLIPGLQFALPAVLGVGLVRQGLLPALPRVLWHWGDFTLSLDLAMMGLFAVAMLLAAGSMLRPAQDSGHEQSETQKPKPASFWLLGALGLGTGAFAGLIGAGGGFIIVPVLVSLAGLKIEEAIGTSLLIIALQSLSGFAADLAAHPTPDWLLLGGFTLLAGLGVLAGTGIAGRIPASRLKPAFGWFVLGMGSLILLKTGLEYL